MAGFPVVHSFDTFRTMALLLPADTTIVLGTHNRKKLLELQSLLAPLDLQVKTLKDFSNPLTVEETGSTFAENARLKAAAQAKHLSTWVLGEDSGLSVDALDGGPGVYSARFAIREGLASEQLPQAELDQHNNRVLLEKLQAVPLSGRTAHYHCYLALSDASGAVILECSGTCSGRIALQPRGSNGFGYDPLFEVVEYHRTFGQLGDRAKSVLSHRGRALRQFVHHLRIVR